MGLGLRVGVRVRARAWLHLRDHLLHVKEGHAAADDLGDVGPLDLVTVRVRVRVRVRLRLRLRVRVRVRVRRRAPRPAPRGSTA